MMTSAWGIGGAQLCLDLVGDLDAPRAGVIAPSISMWIWMNAVGPGGRGCADRAPPRPRDAPARSRGCCARSSSGSSWSISWISDSRASRTRRRRSRCRSRRRTAGRASASSSSVPRTSAAMTPTFRHEIAAVMQLVGADRHRPGALHDMPLIAHQPEGHDDREDHHGDADRRFLDRRRSNRRRTASDQQQRAEPVMKADCPRPPAARPCRGRSGARGRPGVSACRTATRLTSEAAASSSESTRLDSSADRPGHEPGGELDRDQDRRRPRPRHRSRGASAPRRGRRRRRGGRRAHGKQPLASPSVARRE